MSPISPSSCISPVGTAHRLRPPLTTPKKPRPGTASQDTSDNLFNKIRQEINLLPELIKSSYTSWGHGAKEFQLQGICAQLEKTDVLIHAAMGSGKTGIAAAPHLLPSSKGKITIMVSPLLALQDEQVQTFKDEFNLCAIAINSNNSGCSSTILDVRV